MVFLPHTKDRQLDFPRPTVTFICLFVLPIPQEGLRERSVPSFQIRSKKDEKANQEQLN